jgi:hypothetical protein
MSHAVQGGGEYVGSGLSVIYPPTLSVLTDVLTR